jgi:hypothetical protein
MGAIIESCNDVTEKKLGNYDPKIIRQSVRF